MPSVDIVRTAEVKRTARLMQLESLFEMAPTMRSESRWTMHLPFDERDWGIGLIVGASGSGKSTVARELFGEPVPIEWDSDASIVDGFPETMGIKQITELLSSVGFSSPPAWLRPYRLLSTGEQFRVSVARALSEGGDPIVIDEFTSVVDRTVAQIGSAAIAKAVRRAKQRFVAVSCHYDVLEWLRPDWVYQPATDEFNWREPGLRPAVFLDIARCHPNTWRAFRAHHYLDHSLNPVARCFVATLEGRPVAFVAALPFPGIAGMWRGHRTVVLPDFQGIGLGNRISEWLGSMFRAAGKRYVSTTGHPGMIGYRARSSAWNMRRPPSRTSVVGRTSTLGAMNTASRRITASFEYVGASADMSRNDALVFLGVK